MLTVHQWNGVLVIVVCVAAGALAFAARRWQIRGGVLANVLALMQTLLAAQAGMGVLLLLNDKRAADGLHYAYGAFALMAVLAPFLYAPPAPRARLVWFGGAALVAAALAARAYMTAS